jgi:hypothetical protein
LDPHAPDYFADVIQLVRATFTNVEVEIDTTPVRALLRIQARYGLYRIFITEVSDDSGRKYRYYVLRENEVVVGFDNSPDPRALRLKYGQIGEEHIGEAIPHVHRENKTQLLLTEGITCADFVHWLNQQLPL